MAAVDDVIDSDVEATTPAGSAGAPNASMNGSNEIEDSDIEEVPLMKVDMGEQMQDEGKLANAFPRGGDAERLPRDPEPYPTLHPPQEDQLSEARVKGALKVRQQMEKEAVKALEKGDTAKAIECYTDAMRKGGATAMMLATRAALLLKARRPLACIRDCTASLVINPSLVKAYRLRGAAHRRLAHWNKAGRDIAEAQKLKFDSSVAQMQKFVAEQVEQMDAVLGKKKTPAVTPGQASSANEALDAALRLAAPPPKIEVKNLDKGAAVNIEGLVTASHLNGRRGVVERPDPRPTARGRFEVEVRLDFGRTEIKSLKSENIYPLNKADAIACFKWAREEKEHQKRKRLREAQEEQDQYKKCVEAKMKGLQLAPGTCELLREMGFQEALGILDRVNGRLAGTTADDFLVKEARLKLSKNAPAQEVDGQPSKRKKTE